MVKKIMLLTAAALMAQAAPALAQDPPKPNPNVKGSNYMLQKMDTDKNGLVSEAEYLQISRDRFAEMDTNKDGNISPDEAKTSYEQMREKFTEKPPAPVPPADAAAPPADAPPADAPPADAPPATPAP